MKTTSLRALRTFVALLAVATCAGALMAACNTHPVIYQEAQGSIEVIERTNVEGSAKLDMLWVVDNSGSMCQEQKVLRDNFQLFIQKLEETNLDFHIGVTTTHMAENYALEPVAIPGELQSTPQPVPGFDPTCHQAVDEGGQIVEGDWSPIRNAMVAAVKCMADPDSFPLADATGQSPDLEVTLSVGNAEIECAMDPPSNGCTIPAVGCAGGDDGSCSMGECGDGETCNGGMCMPECTPADLFPDQGSYEQLSTVLRSEEYRNTNGTLDIESLKADFACTSFVGTRGYGIEKGLAAALSAVSPEKTGGPIENPAEGGESKPNHGLLRQNSKFALVFVTDENDCSHDGNLKETTTCGGDVCEFANKVDTPVPADFLVDPDENDDPLLDVVEVKDQLLSRLEASKARDSIGDAEVLVASIHGKPSAFNSEIPDPATCSETEYEGIRPTCASQLGVAFSGDRYSSFLKQFEDGQFFPPIESPEDPVAGEMCSGDFGPALEAMGEFIQNLGGGCITRSIYPCDDPDDSCPDFPYSGDAGTCTERPNTDDEVYYCDSGIQIRAEVVDADTDAQPLLEDSGYCVEGSIGDDVFPNGCVVDPARYQWVGCPGGLAGIKLQWNDDIEAQNALRGTEIQIRYNARIESDDEGG